MGKRCIDIYCDGAFKKDGFGGWGAHVSVDGVAYELFGGESGTTNNRMELIAAIEALKSITGPRALVNVYTDSQYVINGITQWIKGWKSRLWVTKDDPPQPVKNKELWQELDYENFQHSVRWHWVKGHAGHAGNERADALANEGVEYARREAKHAERLKREAEQPATPAMKSIAKRRTRPTARPRVAL